MIYYLTIGATLHYVQIAHYIRVLFFANIFNVIDQTQFPSKDKLGVCRPGASKWTKRLCLIKDNQLLVYNLDDDEEEPSESITSLKGCDLDHSYDPENPVIKIVQDENERLSLQVGLNFHG